MSGKYAIDGTDLVTVERAAELLGKTPRQVQRYCQGKDLKPVVQVGRSYLISEQVVRQFTPPPVGRPLGSGGKKTQKRRKSMQGKR